MKVEIIKNNKINVDESGLACYIQNISSELEKQNIKSGLLKKKLILAFIHEEEMQTLNRKFRKKNSTTDILSFSPVEENSLGELALCLPVIYQTRPDIFSNKEWLYYLILHGILHLLGFEHEKGKAEAQKMYHLQDTTFDSLIGKSKRKSSRKI